MSHTRLLCCVALGSVALLTGCGKSLEEEVATAFVASALDTGRNGATGQYAVDARQPTDDGCLDDAAFVAAEAASHPSAGLYPQGCLKKTADGTELHAEFDSCTGPFGRVTLVGGMDATFQAVPGCKVHADVNDSGDFTANEQPLDYSAGADISFADGTWDVAWNAHWTGTTRRGRTVEQTSWLQVQIDDASSCRAVDGTTQGHVDEWEFSTKISGLKLCPDACPAAGSVEGTLQGKLRDRTMRVDFDGSNVAKVTGWSGSEFDVEMVCSGEDGDGE
jgi:hypothetical protein